VKVKFALGVALAALLSTGAPFATAAAAQGSETAEQAAAKAQYEERMKALEGAIHPQSGTVAIPQAKARLYLGDSYYFLPAEDAQRILVEAWGNPPEVATNVLGMVFPKGRSFNDGTWGAVIEYEDTGHISDKDASSQDYDSVLSEMRSAAEEENEARKQQGYPGSHIVGWAQAPAYDAQKKTLIWARDIKFEGVEDDTLNYDVRTLGRSGVLSLNMVDVMPNLPMVRSAAVQLGSTVQFDDGARYTDFDASTDKTAEYGLAGLVAAGAGLAVAKKVGLIGILALVLKKGLVVLLAAGAGAIAWVKKKFGRGDDDNRTGYSG
jgi:uncharacterized membrane-anchored protein